MGGRRKPRCGWGGRPRCEKPRYKDHYLCARHLKIILKAKEALIARGVMSHAGRVNALGNPAYEEEADG